MFTLVYYWFHRFCTSWCFSCSRNSLWICCVFAVIRSSFIYLISSSMRGWSFWYTWKYDDHDHNDFADLGIIFYKTLLSHNDNKWSFSISTCPPFSGGIYTWTCVSGEDSEFRTQRRIKKKRTKIGIVVLQQQQRPDICDSGCGQVVKNQF